MRLTQFSTTPLAPAGMKVIIHMKLGNSASWNYHGYMGWYIGPAPDHYRCFHCFIPSTGKEIVTDTLRLIPQKITFSHMSVEATIKKLMDKIIHLLQQKSVTNFVYTKHKDGILSSFKNVATILSKNPRIFKQQTPTLPKNVTSHGPRHWILDKRRSDIII